mmetsp:Transcript_6722/g.12131  ORF Transcript_6722/g.12131 Transcript_6722/m.12131 type:complete len:86 (+) Transcript_6722:75-332(+)
MGVGEVIINPAISAKKSAKKLSSLQGAEMGIVSDNLTASGDIDDSVPFADLERQANSPDVVDKWKKKAEAAKKVVKNYGEKDEDL